MPTFLPASSGVVRNPLTQIESAEKFPQALNRLAKSVGMSRLPMPYMGRFKPSALSDELGERFRDHGSDKAGHRYHLIYGHILEKLGRENPLNLLEIGIGSQNPEVASHMPSEYQPGALLRAFRDTLPLATVYGGDVDKDVLFSEKRIKTTWVDQTVPESFDTLDDVFGSPEFDLIIDDGLHTVEANINTLVYGLSRLSKTGWIVIEDIWHAQACWRNVQSILPVEKYDTNLYEFENGLSIFVVRRMS
ncbi:MAG: hypothetical protein AAF353_00805 [Pseudomonadota bacterium]